MKAWVDHLASRHTKTIDLTIERVRSFYDRLFPDAWACPVVMVAGTNGKGSVLHALNAIYQAANYKTALYTSPHLMDFRERLTIAGALLGEQRWLDVFSELNAVDGSLDLTFFEFTTLAALLLAKAEKPDVLLLEIGLGGRQDAVNVVPRDVSVITNIALDHQAWLGDTRDKIAYEKAGIIQASVPLVLGELDAPSCIEKEALRLGAPCFSVGRDWSYCLSLKDTASMLFCADGGDSLSCHIPEGIQPGNVATALMAVDSLSDNLPVNASQKQQGVSVMYAPARQERVMCHGIPFVLDVAHNPQAVRSLVDSCVPKHGQGQLWCFFSALQDKDVSGMLAPFRDLDAQWLLFQLDAQRAMPRHHLQALFDAEYGHYTYKSGDLDALWLQLRNRIQPEDTVFVFGSFHVVAALKPYLTSGAEGENNE